MSFYMHYQLKMRVALENDTQAAPGYWIASRRSGQGMMRGSGIPWVKAREIRLPVLIPSIVARIHALYLLIPLLRSSFGSSLFFDCESFYDPAGDGAEEAKTQREPEHRRGARRFQLCGETKKPAMQ